MPGTFGDPFRVIQTLPGVASVVSLLPFPIVRGASPSSTGFLLDGTRVPLLFHLLSGPERHPPRVHRRDPVLPRRRARAVRRLHRRHRRRPHARARARTSTCVDFDANLLQAGGFVREPVTPLGATVTAAGRYGYPGFLLGLATNQVSLSYWDYQLRLDGGTARNGWTVFVFGARDELDTAGAQRRSERTRTRRSSRR